MTDQGTKVNTRALALDFLLETAEKGGYSHVVMRGMLEKYQYLDKKERAFLTRLSEGTLERMLELDAIIDKFSKVPVKKMKPVIRNLLRLSVYQLKYMDQIPDSAVCNEAVKLAQKKGFSSLKGFVNGVLRNIARELPNVKFEDLSIQYSTSPVDCGSVVSEYGEEKAARDAGRPVSGEANDHPGQSVKNQPGGADRAPEKRGSAGAGGRGCRLCTGHQRI